MGAFGLDGRHYVVTGGGAGIGRAVVTALLAGGARVVSFDVAAEHEGGDGLRCLRCDVRDREAVRHAMDEAVGWLGGLDGVVQSAGITRDAVLWKLDDIDWEAVVDVNLSGAFRVLRVAVPHLRAAGGGSVVHIASINGLRGKFGQSNYSASKAGLLGFTRTAARELGAFGIRVNAVAPGMVRTAMTADLPPAILERAVEESALKRISEPEDVAGVVLFLLSDHARQITGETLRVDAGQTA